MPAAGTPPWSCRSPAGLPPRSCGACRNVRPRAAIARPARTAGTVPVARRDPSCGLAEATTAGEADLGGRTYTAPDAPDAQRCYPGDGRASLLVLPRGAGRLVLL